MQRSGNSGAGQASPQAHCAVLERFSKHRRWNSPISRELMTDPETRDIGRKIANCALNIKAGIVLKDGEEPEASLRGAQLCNTRFCPFCEARRTKALRARLYQGLTALYEEQPKLRGVFLTLTVRNAPLEDLGTTLDEMNRAWNRFRQCSFFPTDLWFRRTEITVGTPTTGKSFSAVASSLEGDRYYVHPHFHVLLLVRPSYFSRNYIKKSEWQKQWQMALRADYAPVVDVRSAKTNFSAGSTAADASKSAVVEAAKYAAKATALLELGPAITEMHWQLRKRRLVAISQKLNKYIPDKEISQEEMLDQESKPLPPGAERLEVMARWFEDLQEYVISDVLS